MLADSGTNIGLRDALPAHCVITKLSIVEDERRPRVHDNPHRAPVEDRERYEKL